jgi:hypothetical protein
MAEKALILIKKVFLTIWPLRILEFRVAKPATVLVPVMAATPQSSFIPFGFIADEAGLACIIMRMTSRLC